MTSLTATPPGTSVGTRIVMRGLAVATFSAGTFAAPLGVVAPPAWTATSPDQRSIPGRVVVSTPRLDLGGTVRQLRHRTGLSWAQLAEALGISRRAIHFWADGGNISAANAARLSAISAQVDELGSIPPDEVRLAILVGDRGTPPLMKQWLAANGRARSQDVLPVDAALGGPSGQYPQPTYGKARSAGRVPVQLKEI